MFGENTFCLGYNTYFVFGKENDVAFIIMDSLWVRLGLTRLCFMHVCVYIYTYICIGSIQGEQCYFYG